jgi:hypothetical protein
MFIQGDQKDSAYQSPERDTRLTLTPSVIPNSNYVIMASDWNFLKYFCLFLYGNNQVHRDFLITLYKNYLLNKCEILHSFMLLGRFC